MHSTTIEPKPGAKELQEAEFPRSLIVIPARMGGKRLPGKSLFVAGGKALIYWTYEQAEKVQNSTVVVATSSGEIAQYCNSRGLRYTMTEYNHPTGTHRCAEAANGSWRVSPSDVDVIVNWQCDEPLVDPKDVERMILSTPNWISPIRTLVSRRFPDEDPTPRKSVKVVVSDSGRCLWFSRAVLAGASYHVGIYFYSLGTLNKITERPPTRLSKLEGLEQLSWIERGVEIEVVEIESTLPPLAINDKDDFESFRKMKEGKVER